VLEQVARLAPRVDKVGELQQLAKPDHFPPNGYLAPSRHLWESGDVMALPQLPRLSASLSRSRSRSA
jgi:hypothetical protein